MSREVIQLTPVELELMRVLWNSRTATARDVVNQIQERRSVAYTTVQTQLNILVKKGYASASTNGVAHVYKPRITEEEAQHSAVGSLLGSFFDQSGVALAQQLVRTGSLDADDIEQLRKLVDSLDSDAAGDDR